METLRAILVICLIGIALLAVFYLRQRQLSLLSYCFWGLVALLLPAVGPGLIMIFHPGQPHIRGAVSPLPLY